ncbi:hypothetical protein I6N95_05430 [Vagococcus sp. BWB3-3]|uniref:Uncharacterized protein n=1 Tax=Vagococcus allomyrinae TaxID=2794353 RepID=A0A940SVL6_9ENTE|nr:hypothetical protein [Vagococcus allomyrinae]MBP1040453.1 hypothetical protein [Vagococcus allomyrinae]
MTPKPISHTLAYPLLIAVLRTLMAILPGLLLVEDRVDISFALVLLILYLVLSEVFQVLIQQTHASDQSFSLNLYIGKVVIGIICIWIITNKLAPQYGIILLMYEIFQFFIFSEKYNYQETILYTCLNAFFKGIVFNLVISIHYPYAFKPFYFWSYVFSFLIVLIGTFLTQSLYARRDQSGTFNRLSLFSFLFLIGFLAYQVYMKHLNWLLLLPIIITIFLATWFILRHNNRKKRELTLNAALLLILFIYYI